MGMLTPNVFLPTDGLESCISALIPAGAVSIVGVSLLSSRWYKAWEWKNPRNIFNCMLYIAFLKAELM